MMMILSKFLVSRCCLDFSVSVGAFVTRLSQITSYFFKDVPNLKLFDVLFAFRTGFTNMTVKLSD